MRENLDRWLKEILRHEGGYVDHPRDPGGATNMGITHKTLASWRGKPVTKDDVRRLGLAEVTAIYKANYWDVVECDHLPTGLDLVAFDAAVNSGPSRGAKWLQAALYVTADGKIGPKTIAAAGEANVKDAIIRACEMRTVFLKGLETWPTFGKGWTRRIDGVRITALQAATAPKEIYPTSLPKTPVPRTGGVAEVVIAAVVAIIAAVWYILTKGQQP